jgi:hypothetical protein
MAGESYIANPPLYSPPQQGYDVYNPPGVGSVQYAGGPGLGGNAGIQAYNPAIGSAGTSAANPLNPYGYAIGGGGGAAPSYGTPFTAPVYGNTMGGGFSGGSSSAGPGVFGNTINPQSWNQIAASTRANQNPNMYAGGGYYGGGGASQSGGGFPGPLSASGFDQYSMFGGGGAGAGNASYPSVGSGFVGRGNFGGGGYGANQSGGGPPSYGMTLGSMAQPGNMVMSQADRDNLIRTVYGEAANQGPLGQAAVANTVLNRMTYGGYGGPTIQGVTGYPNAYSNWNPVSQGGNLLGQNLMPNQPQYGAIGNIVDQVYSGMNADPTRGAANYYNPSQVNPSWAKPLWQQNLVDIGQHRFVGTGPTRISPGQMTGGYYDIGARGT